MLSLMSSILTLLGNTPWWGWAIVVVIIFILAVLLDQSPVSGDTKIENGILYMYGKCWDTRENKDGLDPHATEWFETTDWYEVGPVETEK